MADVAGGHASCKAASGLRVLINRADGKCACPAPASNDCAAVTPGDGVAPDWNVYGGSALITSGGAMAEKI